MTPQNSLAKLMLRSFCRLMLYIRSTRDNFHSDVLPLEECTLEASLGRMHFSCMTHNGQTGHLLGPRKAIKCNLQFITFQVNIHKTHSVHLLLTA